MPLTPRSLLKREKNRTSQLQVSVGAEGAVQPKVVPRAAESEVNVTAREEAAAHVLRDRKPVVMAAGASSSQVIANRKTKRGERDMTMENAIRILAGTMILLSLTLSHFFSQYWLLLTAFVGVNLIQSAFTGFCPAEKIFAKLGVGKGGKSCCAS
jgi:hypothetical protein